MLKKINKKLLWIIIGGLLLRLIGIDHAFPFIFHPDESTVVQSALEIRFNLNPGHFDWPHLYMYLNYFLYMGFAKLRDLISIIGYKEDLYYVVPIIWNDNLIFYLLTRILTAVFGALTAIPVYLSAKTLFNEKAGLFAAIALMLTPFHVLRSHYTMPDVPMLFFLSWVLYFSIKILFVRGIKNYIFAGMFVGLAASVKYDGALSVLFIVLAHFIRVFSEKDEYALSIDSLGNLIISALTSVVAFVLGTPYSILDYKTFMITENAKGALWQFTNVGNVTFFEQIRTFFISTPLKLIDDFGYSLFILFLLSIFYLIFNIVRAKKLFAKKDFLFLILVTVTFLFYLSGAEKTRSHYFFVAYPTIIILGTGFLINVTTEFRNIVSNIIFVLLLAIPLIFSARVSYIFTQKDTRTQLYGWLTVNKITKQIFYNGNDLKIVFEKNGGTKPTKFEQTSKIQPRSVYILSYDPGVRFISLESAKLIKTFNNRLRQGPIINIYETQ